jgi:hypothetical protein
MHPDDVGDDLLRALAALGRTQGLWLADLYSTLPGGVTAEGHRHGDPAFSEAFRRWAEQLTAVRLQTLRGESHLLHFVIAAEGMEATTDIAAPGPDQDLHRDWRRRFTAWFAACHLDGTYRLLENVSDLDGEPVNADIVTDFASLAELMAATSPALAHLAATRDLRAAQDLAFFHVIAPWRARGRRTLDQVLRWLDEQLADAEAW